MRLVELNHVGVNLPKLVVHLVWSSISNLLGRLGHVGDILDALDWDASHTAYRSSAVLLTVVHEVAGLLHLLPLSHDNLLTFVHDLGASIWTVDEAHSRSDRRRNSLRTHPRRDGWTHLRGADSRAEVGGDPLADIQTEGGMRADGQTVFCVDPFLELGKESLVQVVHLKIVYHRLLLLLLLNRVNPFVLKPNLLARGGSMGHEGLRDV